MVGWPFSIAPFGLGLGVMMPVVLPTVPGLGWPFGRVLEVPACAGGSGRDRPCGMLAQGGGWFIQT